MGLKWDRGQTAYPLSPSIVMALEVQLQHEVVAFQEPSRSSSRIVVAPCVKGSPP